MEKKGFNLIKKIIIISILIIIILILTFLTMNAIKSFKVKKYLSDVKEMVNIAETRLEDNTLEVTNKVVDLSTLNDNEINIIGEMKINEDNQIALALWNNDLQLCAIKDYSDINITIDDTKSKDNCIINVPTLNLTSADAEYSCITFNSDTKTITSINSNCSVSTISIPTTIDSVSVEIIGESALIGTGIVSSLDFTYASNLTTISDNAFNSDSAVISSIKALDNATQLTIIGDNAFYGNDITNLIFPSSLKEIGVSAFEDNNISDLTLNEGLEIINYNSFSNNNLTGIIIPSTVTILATEAFYNQAPGLTSVTIKGKISETDFTTYGNYLWSWGVGYSDSNIIWNE